MATLVFGCLAGAILAGRAMRRRLPQDHLGGDSRDSVKLALGLVATMTALLLGLLVGSAKASYDASRSQVIQLAAKIALLDRVLASFGPEGGTARAHLRTAVGTQVMRLWSGNSDAPPPGTPDVQTGNALYAEIHALNPHDDAQKALKGHAVALAAELAQIHSLLLAQSISSLSLPLLVAVVAWLVVIFLGFSLLAPANATAGLALTASALSVSVAIFLILELDTPFDGLFQIPKAPLVHALKAPVQ